MLFRVIYRLIDIKSYFHHYFSLLSAKISYFEDDYSRFLEQIFNLLIKFIFKPIVNIIKFILFCLNVILFIFKILLLANNIFLRIVFIIIPTNITYFFFSFLKYDLRYLCMEFIFMFVDSYVLSFKYQIRCFFIECKNLSADLFGYPEGYGSFAMEIYPDEYQEYLDSFDNNLGPDLQVHYPMRFALSSVMIRLTGVILAVSFFFVLFFNFTNIFIIVHGNLSELRRTLDYKLIETLQSYRVQEIKYSDSNKYNNSTFYSTFKCIMYLIYSYVKICLNYLFFDALVRFELIEIFKIKYLIFGFFYNFFINIFILVLPIHFYYVVYHSYKIIYISKYVGYLFFYLKKIIIFFFKTLWIVLKKIWNVFYDIMTSEEPDVHAPKSIKDNKIVEDLKKK